VTRTLPARLTTALAYYSLKCVGPRLNITAAVDAATVSLPDVVAPVNGNRLFVHQLWLIACLSSARLGDVDL